MTHEKKHGGYRPGAGRKPIGETRTQIYTASIMPTLNAEIRQTYGSLGNGVRAIPELRSLLKECVEMLGTCTSSIFTTQEMTDLMSRASRAATFKLAKPNSPAK